MTYYNDHLVKLIERGATMEDAVRDASLYFGVSEDTARRIIKLHGIQFPSRGDN